MKHPFLVIPALILFISGAVHSQVVPLVDYHQHLISEPKAKAMYDPPLPAITLPNDLADLVRARESAWNNKQSLAALLTEDALMLNTQDEDFPTWMRGRDGIAEELTRYFSRAHTITPVAFRIDGNSGYIAGYYTRNDRHFGHILLTLRKENDKWMIAAEAPTFPGPFRTDPSTAEQLIAQLDDAGIQRAVVMSLAYQWGSPFNTGSTGEYDRVKDENNYLAREVGKYPQRLIGFCGFNPLKEYAVREMERCQTELKLKGVKLHFGNSRVDVRNPEHLEKVQAVFRRANSLRMPIVAHLWTSPAFEKEGDQHARIFLEKILPLAPSITIQVAHLTGGGRSTPVALKVFADAIAAGNRHTRNLYFDVATSVQGQTAAGLREDAVLMRRIGLDRILYGTDTSPPNPPARVSWAHFKGLMPLTEVEIKKIAGNIAPYLK